MPTEVAWHWLALDQCPLCQPTALVPSRFKKQAVASPLPREMCTPQEAHWSSCSWPLTGGGNPRRGGLQVRARGLEAIGLEAGLALVCCRGGFLAESKCETRS